MAFFVLMKWRRSYLGERSYVFDETFQVNRTSTRPLGVPLAGGRNRVQSVWGAASAHWARECITLLLGGVLENRRMAPLVFTPIHTAGCVIDTLSTARTTLVRFR